ncbi:MAG: carboxypeptidase-like regulatory domain-containing protein [Cyclobacteriaceae bacterium]|nr:carboxypeptidase-like regulatory domain-containing protein [Cyclobacteriaceae bacterium SS2]
MRFCFLAFALFSVYFHTNAEDFQAVILDEKTGEPLPFSTITIEGTYSGTVANAEGMFNLDIGTLTGNEVIIITHLGYEPKRIAAKSLNDLNEIRLKPSSIQLSEVAVYADKLTAREILERVQDRFAENHPGNPLKREVFFHRFERAKFPKENKLLIKSSDFVGIDKRTTEEFLRKLPEEFIEYQDAILNYYTAGSERKIQPVEGISMEEGAAADLMKEFENHLVELFEDIDKTNLDEDRYYKFRTGIFSFKADDPAEMSMVEVMNDSLHYLVPSKDLSGTLSFLLKDYSHIEGKNWEFVTNPGKYVYSLEGLTLNHDRWVYHIKFTPKNRGLFQGEIFVDSEDFGVHQVSFEYMDGKYSERFQVLGMGHSMDYKKGHVIFQKTKSGYYTKYIRAEQKEQASIARDFTIMKKEKRFMWDKTLNEVKMEVEMNFDMHNQWELLIMNTEPIVAERLSSIEQPKHVKFKKKLVYDPAMWKNRTVLVPTAELQKFSR